MSLEQYTIPAEVLAEAENMMEGDFKLKIPESAALKNNFYRRWTENVVVESTHHEEKEGRAGQKRIQFVLKYKVLPSEGSVNVGRTFTGFFLYNFGALAGNVEAIGQGTLASERKLSTITAGKLKQLAAAANLPLDEGLTGETMEIMFPALLEMPPEEEEYLPGMKFVFTILNNSNPDKAWPKGSTEVKHNSQGIDSIAPLEDDDAE